MLNFLGPVGVPRQLKQTCAAVVCSDKLVFTAVRMGFLDLSTMCQVLRSPSVPARDCVAVVLLVTIIFTSFCSLSDIANTFQDMLVLWAILKCIKVPAMRSCTFLLFLPFLIFWLPFAQALAADLRGHKAFSEHLLIRNSYHCFFFSSIVLCHSDG